MVLSGAQSTGSAATIDITDVAPYLRSVPFFLVSAVWLTVSDARRKAVEAAG